MSEPLTEPQMAQMLTVIAQTLRKGRSTGVTIYEAMEKRAAELRHEGELPSPPAPQKYPIGQPCVRRGCWDTPTAVAKDITKSNFYVLENGWSIPEADIIPIPARPPVPADWPQGATVGWARAKNGQFLWSFNELWIRAIGDWTAENSTTDPTRGCRWCQVLPPEPVLIGIPYLRSLPPGTTRMDKDRVYRRGDDYVMCWFRDPRSGAALVYDRNATPPWADGVSEETTRAVWPEEGK